jgi:hypothetical protein
MNTRIICIAVAVFAAGLVQADPPAGKGQGNPQAQGQGQGHGQAQGQGSAGDYDDHDGGKSQDNKGQVTSDCNHLANQRNLKGQERKQWVEWCQDRGGAYHYDDNRWKSERSCYQKADDKGLSGDKRKKYLKNCFENHPEQKHQSDKPKYTK